MEAVVNMQANLDAAIDMEQTMNTSPGKLEQLQAMKEKLCNLEPLEPDGMLKVSVDILQWRQTAHLENLHMINSKNWVHYVFEALAVACVKAEPYMPGTHPATHGTRYRLASHEGGHISQFNKAMRELATKTCVRNTETLQTMTSDLREARSVLRYGHNV